MQTPLKCSAGALTAPRRRRKPCSALAEELPLQGFSERHSLPLDGEAGGEEVPGKPEALALRRSSLEDSVGGGSEWRQEGNAAHNRP